MRASSDRVRARALIAEDDDVFRTLLAATLRRDGFEVVEARNGRELLQTVAGTALRASAPFDLVISDLAMPVMGGLEALAGLRAAEWGVPFIAITAFGDELARAKATRLGAAAFFAKPFDLADLRTAALYLTRR